LFSVQSAYASYNSTMLDCGENTAALDTLSGIIGAAIAAGLPDSTGTIYLSPADRTDLPQLAGEPATDPNTLVNYNPLSCEEVILCDTFIVKKDTIYRQQELVSYTLDTVYAGEAIDTIIVHDLITTELDTIVLSDTTRFRRQCSGPCGICDFGDTVDYHTAKTFRLYRGWKQNRSLSANQYIGFYEDEILVPGCGQPVQLRFPITYGDEGDDQFDEPVFLDDSIFGKGYYGHVRFIKDGTGTSELDSALFSSHAAGHAADSVTVFLRGRLQLAVHFNSCVDYTRPCDTCTAVLEDAPMVLRDTVFGFCQGDLDFTTAIRIPAGDCGDIYQELPFQFLSSDIDMLQEIGPEGFSEPAENSPINGPNGMRFADYNYAISGLLFTGDMAYAIDTEACFFVYAFEGVVDGLAQFATGDQCPAACTACTADFSDSVYISSFLDTTHIFTSPDGDNIILLQLNVEVPGCGNTIALQIPAGIPAFGVTYDFLYDMPVVVDEVGYTAYLNPRAAVTLTHGPAGVHLLMSGVFRGTALFSSCDESATPLTACGACTFTPPDTVFEADFTFLDADASPCVPINAYDSSGSCPVPVEVDNALRMDITLAGCNGSTLSYYVTTDFSYPACGTGYSKYGYDYTWPAGDAITGSNYHAIDSITIERVNGPGIGCVDTIKVHRRHQVVAGVATYLSYMDCREITSPYGPTVFNIYATTDTLATQENACISLRPVNAPDGFDWSQVTGISGLVPDAGYTTAGENYNFTATASISGGGSLTIRGTACVALQQCEVVSHTMSFHQYFNALYGTRLGCDDISDVQCSCNDSIGRPLKRKLAIPDTLTCRHCIRCPQLQAALDSFAAQNPYISDTSVYYSDVLTTYLNDAFGYQLTYPEYKQFIDYCQDSAGTQELCNKPPFVVTPPDCEDYQLAIAEENAGIAYTGYIDSLRRDFEERYVAKCMGIPEVYKLSKPEHEYHYTLYYYDQAGNLIKTVPPLGVNPLSKTQVAQVATSRKNGYNTAVKPSHALESVYQFNTLNQDVWERSPDGGIKKMFYDALGRMVAARDSEMLASPDSLVQYVLYDELNRIKETGIAFNAGMDAALAKNSTSFALWYSLVGKRNLSRTYYDEPLSWVPAYFSNGEQNNLRNRVATTTWQDRWNPRGQNPGDSIRSYFAYHYNYDVAGNVDELLNENRLMPAPHRIKHMNYAFDLISGKVNKVIYQQDAPDQFIHRYEYDADNRIIRTYTSRDGLIEETDAEYFYYKHGPLARTELGENKVQGLDYAYTIQGWTKGMNSGSVNQPGRDMGKDGLVGSGNVQQYTARDAAGYTLGYFSGDYASIGTSSFEAGYNTSGFGSATNLYNGNIRHMATAIRKFGEVRGSTYRYDQLNRLTRVDNYLSDMAANSWNSITGIQDWHERFRYDANGNILDMLRRGTTKGGRSLGMDSVAFTLVSGTNRLYTYNDRISTGNYPEDLDSSGTLYAYNRNGSVTVDNSTGNKFAWNDYNLKLKQAITKNDTLEFAYDVLGNRNVKSKLGKDTSIYVNDASGSLMAIYKLNKDSLYLIEQPLYGSSRLGMESVNKLLWHKDTAVVYNDISYNTVRGNKQYEVANHLGNVLVTVSDMKVGVDSTGNDTIDYYNPVTITATDYYAYGGPLPERSFSASEYRWSFNGKEKDDEVSGKGNSYDFGARTQDTRIGGRFLSVDPRHKDFLYMSPYCYAANSPIALTDENGEGPGMIRPIGVASLAFVSQRTNQLIKQGYSPFLANLRATSEYAAIPFVAVAGIVLGVETAGSISGYVVANAPQLIAAGVSAKELVERNPKLAGDAATFVAELLNPGPPIQSPYDGEELAGVLKGAGKAFNQKVAAIMVKAFETKISKKVVSKVTGTYAEAYTKFKDIIGKAKIEPVLSKDGKFIEKAKLEDGTTVTFRNFSSSETDVKAVIDINKEVDKGAKTTGIEIKFFDKKE
jgi:RHS repeat-associated protein